MLNIAIFDGMRLEINAVSYAKYGNYGNYQLSAISNDNEILYPCSEIKQWRGCPP